MQELQRELNDKNEQITNLEQQLSNQDSNSKPEYWYAFEPTTEYNIAKLSEGESEVIDQIELVDSVDLIYTFKHSTTISQLRDNRLTNFFSNYSQHQDIFYGTGRYGPMVEDTPFYVRTFVVCEEPGLPIETENCTDNIYIIVQPTELGYESNLFKISRLFGTEIKSLAKSEDGVILTLEHSKFPRKELKIRIQPHLVKFLE